MAQQPNDTDFEALFAAEAANDDMGETPEPVSREAAAPIEKPAPKATQEQEQDPEPEPVRAEEPEPEPEPEPELTPEQAEEQERQETIALVDLANRRVRDFQRATGKPLVAPEVVERQNKSAQAIADLEETTPELADAVKAIVADAVSQEREHIQEALGQESEVLSEQMHHTAIYSAGEVGAAAAEIQRDPAEYAKLKEWVDLLPGRISKEFDRILEEGEPEEVLGLVSDYLAFPDAQEATAMYLNPDQSEEHVEEPTQSQAPRPQARQQQPRKTPPAAALAVRSGNTRALPGGSGPVLDEYEAAYRDLRQEELREERESA